MPSIKQIIDRLRKAGKSEAYIASYLRGWHQVGLRKKP